VGIAESWWECASFGLESPKEAAAIGRYAVSRALELDPLFGDGVSMLGIYSGVHDFDWAASERYFKQALELDPASPDIHRRHAAYLLEPTNRLAEAHAELETALDLDPLSPVVLAYLGQCLMFERQSDEAVERLHESAEIDPGYWMAQFLLAGAAAFQGQFEKSLAIAEAALRATGLNPIVLGAAGSMYGLLGQRARAQECLSGCKPPARLATYHRWPTPGFISVCKMSKAASTGWRKRSPNANRRSSTFPSSRCMTAFVPIRGSRR